MLKLIRVTQVEALAGWRLRLRFDDGSSGIADLADRLSAGPLSALRRDERLWRQAQVDAHGAVVWNDDLDLAPEYLHALANGLAPPRTAEDVLANQLTVTMRQLRAAAGKSQVEVAASMGVAQGEVSRLEARSDTKLSTLERYVRALGGELEVVARIGDRSFRVGFGEADG